MKHTIYFTISFVLLLGIIIGLILATEIFTSYEKGKAIVVIVIYSLTIYLAGTEYHELKRKLKSK